MKSSKDASLKWGKETEHQAEKVPLTAVLYPSSQLQDQQQSKLPDKTLSSLLPASKPPFSVTENSSYTDSGMYSSGSYLNMNGDAEKHRMLSHDQSSMEFYPLHAYIDSESPKVGVLLCSTTRPHITESVFYWLGHIADILKSGSLEILHTLYFTHYK